MIGGSLLYEATTTNRKFNVTFNRKSTVTFLGGLESFAGDEIVVVVESKKWDWLPLPEHRSFIRSE